MKPLKTLLNINLYVSHEVNDLYYSKYQLVSITMMQFNTLMIYWRGWIMDIR